MQVTLRSQKTYDPSCIANIPEYNLLSRCSLYALSSCLTGVMTTRNNHSVSPINPTLFTGRFWLCG